jgi:hypothetical protein
MLQVVVKDVLQSDSLESIIFRPISFFSRLDFSQSGFWAGDSANPVLLDWEL